MNDTAPVPAVPEDFRGVWKRTLRRSGMNGDAAGPACSDSLSWVRWLQTASWHGQLHVPPPALDGCRALPLDQLDTTEHRALAAQQGFAGVTQFQALPEGPVCTWLRRMDYQPPGLHPDAGWLLTDRPGHLIEIGVHEDYDQVWERLPGSSGRCLVLSGLDAQGQDDGRRLLVAGMYVMLARPRRARWPRGIAPGATLEAVLESYPEFFADWLDCEFAFGTLVDEALHLERSTLPERAGLSLPIAIHRRDDDLADIAAADTREAWRILEWTCDADDIAA